MQASQKTMEIIDYVVETSHASKYSSKEKVRSQKDESYIVRTWIRAQFAVQGPDLGGVLEAQNQRIFIYGWEKSTKSWMISSIPQLQPEMSINKVFVFGEYNTKDSLMTVDLSSGETFESPVFPQPRNDYSIAVKNEFIFIFGGYYEGKCLQVCEKFDTLNNTISKLTDMLNLRYGSSALNIPGMGIIVVGGCDRIGSIFPTLRSIEMLIEDESEENGAKWIEFSPMLKERHRPGVALFQGSIIVAGGDMNFTIEYYPLTAGDQEISQWTFINGIDEYNLKRISLVTLASNDSQGNIYEFSQDQEAYFRAIGCPEASLLNIYGNVSQKHHKKRPATFLQLAPIVATRVNNFTQVTIKLFLIRNIYNSIWIITNLWDLKMPAWWIFTFSHDLLEALGLAAYFNHVHSFDKHVESVILLELQLSAETYNQSPAESKVART
ncbi:hypothetical protein ACTXT7_012814 [Hymenolepis weldensis]